MIFIILFPLLSAFLILLSPLRVKSLFLIISLSLTFAFSFFIKITSRYGYLFYPLPLDWISISFVFDRLSIFMAVVSSFVSLLIGLYSLEYIKSYPNKTEFYFWVVLFVGAMMGLIFSNQLLLMYCFWEITAICSWKLIGFYGTEKDNKAAQRAFLTTFLGASLLLLGIIMIYLEHKTLNLNLLQKKDISDLVAGLFLCGILSKSAQLPFQSWLPDAGVAPTPVTALLHAAVLVKIGVYAFLRIFGLVFEVSSFFQNFCRWLGAFTIIVSAGCALRENNMKRILAYSTISQLGYIIVLSSFKNEFAFKISLLYILAHSLAKAGLFLCIGIIEHKSGIKDINQLGGLLKTMPLVGMSYLLCAFSIIGLPPFLGFWSKIMGIIIVAEYGYLWLAGLLVLGAIFTLFYLIRLFHYVFCGELKIELREDKNSIMLYVCLILGFLSLILGVLIKAPLTFI